jgi:endonuclease-3
MQAGRRFKGAPFSTLIAATHSSKCRLIDPAMKRQTTRGEGTKRRPVVREPAPGRRVAAIIARLKKTHPDATLALDFSSPFELLIALILAAQCTDDRVNEVTGTLLFKKYRSPADYVRVPAAELEADIRPTGFYRNKAKAVQACCQQLIERFGGQVPRSMEELTSLRGVGRKTANIVRGNAFGQPAIGVDTHVMRLSQRLALTTQHDPDKIEVDLTQLVPLKEQTHFCHLLQYHGRRICVARKPRCPECVISDLCPYPDKTPPAPPRAVRPAFGRKPE